jgi:membrane protease subunit HflC
MKTGFLLALGTLLLALFVLSHSLFVVHANEHAVLLRFGEVVDGDLKPGLHALIPLVDDVRDFDARTQISDVETTPLLTADKNYLVLDAYVVWKVGDVRKYVAVTGGSAHETDARLLPLVREALKDSLASHTVADIVAAGHEPSLAMALPALQVRAAELGILVSAAEVRRVQYASSVQAAVYQRMNAGFKVQADSLRADTRAEADRIAAAAQEGHRVILADGSRQAEQLRGEGDGKAAAIVAQVAGGDAEFYRFYRSMEIYRKGLGKSQNVLVLGPDDDLLKYLKAPGK